MHEWVDRLLMHLPWYRREEAAEREQRAEAARVRAIEARKRLEQAYEQADKSVRRK